MADRSVKVTLRAEVAQYLDGMEKAAKKTRDMGSEAEKLAQKREAFEMLGRASLALGVAAAAGVAIAVAKFAEFDQAMSNVNAVMQETTENQKALRQAALDFGASSVFTAKESANAIEELGKAGISTADILSGALSGSLNLASAGELGIARAAEIAATTLQQFGLAGDQAGRVADVLAAGAGKAMGSVEDLAQGMKFVGPIAAAMGISLEETTGVLALFAQQGIIGEQAGTSLRGMLSSLTSPSKEARKEMETLGITLYDAQGGFLGLENAAGELERAYAPMTDAQRDASLGVLFGNQQITAARVLYDKGAVGVRTWTRAVDDSGYAAQVARDRLDNLKGDVEALGGAFDTALITTGSAANDVLRTMTQSLTNVIDLYNDAPEPVKVTALAVGGLAAAAGLAGAAFLLGAPKVAAFNAALATMGPTAQKAGAALTASAGPIGIAFVAAGAALAIFAGRQAEAAAQTQAYADTLEQSTARVTRATRELVVQSLQATPDFWERLFGSTSQIESVFDSAEKLGLGLEKVTDAAMGSPEAFGEVSKYLLRLGKDEEFAREEADRLGISYTDLVNAADNTSRGIKGQSDSLVAAVEATKQKQQADKAAAKQAEDHADALSVLEGKAESTTDSIDDLASAIRGFGSATLSVREANRALEASYDDLTAAVNDNGTSLDITTEAGRANQSAIDDVVKSALEAAAATLEQTSSQEKANEVLAAGRDRLHEMLAPFGLVGDAADAYIDELGLIPENISTAVILTTDAATAAAQAFVDKYQGKTISMALFLESSGGNKAAAAAASRLTQEALARDRALLGQADGSVMDFYADGGMRENHVAQIAPAGSWRVWAEPETGGEAYIPLAESKRARSLQIWQQTGARLGVRGFADGGVVQYASSRAGRGSSSVNVSPTVSLAGATLLMSVDGRQMQAVIQDQIVRSDQRSGMVIANGKK